MATDVSSLPNGSYAAHQGYGGGEPNGYNPYSYSNANTSQLPSAQVPPTSSTTGNTSTTSTTPQQTQADISKDEVGWYFVEQYYTTLSRNPEKLYLFYNKRSQFVSGQETDKVPVCVGQRAINDKIRELDFHDCKVRVTNVDSQSSDSNIVIQVIGEISNRSQPHKKFTQTFVLATQTNGYFVLNDIFRYLVEEDEEPETEAANVSEAQQPTEADAGFLEPTHSKAEPSTLTSSSNSTAVEHDAKSVEKKSESKLSDQLAAAQTVNGTKGSDTNRKAPEVPSATGPEPTQPAGQVATEARAVEKPKEPEPTRAASPAKREVPQTAAPAKPAAPKTWANLAASAVATPAAPVAAAAASAQRSTPPTSKPANAKPGVPTSSTPSAAPAAPQAPSAPASQRQDTQTPDSQDEWTAVGGSHHRQQSRQGNAAQVETPQNRGYIKNVREDVSQEELKAALEKFGELTYLDISRAKNCAFVDFKTSEGFSKALQSPLDLSGDMLYVEERRFRTGATPYTQRGQFQGNRGNRGGSNNQGTPRGGFQNNGNRGNTGTRGGRGGTPAPRGRGQS